MKAFYSIFLLSVILFSCVNSSVKNENKVSISSPDEKIRVSVFPDSTGLIKYQINFLEVSHAESEILAPSDLGLSFRESDFSAIAEIIAAEGPVQHTEDYSLHAGKSTKIAVAYNEVKLRVKTTTDSELAIVFRVFNDGVAFRYEIPQLDAYDSITLIEDHTTFNVAHGNAWMQKYDSVAADWRPAYEQPYEKVPVGQDSPDSFGWCFPATFEKDHHWLLITEANVGRNYCAAHLQQNSENGIYGMKLPEEGEANGVGNRFPVSQLPLQTSWRVMVVGDELKDLVESNLVSHVADPAAYTAHYAVPGKSSWSWWSNQNGPWSIDEYRSYIDLSAALGWKYSLIDVEWHKQSGEEMKELISYANEKDVDVWLWFNSGGPNNTVRIWGPYDSLWDAQTRKRALHQVAEWGAAGVKVDFFNSDNQRLINHYIDLLEDAHAEGLMVNFHGCTMPRGWSRTYPNLMTMEAVLGAEAYGFKESYPEMAPVLNCIYPYTRNIVGPLDYTPVTLSDNKFPHITTNAHELALAVIFESGIVHMADKVSSYKSQPDQVKAFLSAVPAAWDEIKFIQGYPGEEVVLARRKGEQWFVAGINGTGQARTISLSADVLDFIDQEVVIIADGEEQQAFKIQETSANNISLLLPPYGGFVAYEL